MSTFDPATVSTDSVQLELVLTPLVPPEYTSPELADRFAAFHAANPHVADALEYLAQAWFDAGRQAVGMGALYERLRWESGIRTEGAEYRLDNSFRSYYSRLLIARHPEWAERIRTRVQPTAPNTFALADTG